MFVSAALLATLFLPVRPRAQSGATFREDAEYLYLENDDVTFVFGKAGQGGIEGIIDRASGVDFRTDKTLPAALFNLTAVEPDGSTKDISNLSPCAFTYEDEEVDGATRLTLSYENLDGRALSVVAVVTLAHDSPRAEWHIGVQNDDPALVLNNAAFPLIFGLSAIGSQADDDALAFPLLDGVLLHDPQNSLASGDGLFAVYPADASLQMMAFYDEGAGLYLAAHDPTGQPKAFAFARLTWEDREITLFTINHTLPEEAGHDFDPEYATVLGPFHGDWYDAAMIYKEWATQQPWTPPPLSDRSDVPEWWKRAPPIIAATSYDDDGNAHLPAEHMPDRAYEYARYLDQPVTLLTFGWEKHGAWIGPDHFPPRDGEELFRAATDALRDDGNHKMVYVSGTVWRLSRRGIEGYDGRARFEETGRPYAALEREGAPYHDPFYASIGWEAVRMCPATEFWQETVVSVTTEAARLGVDAVSVDEFPIGSIYSCYATDHGHPPGRGLWQGEAYRIILERARHQGRAINPDLVLTSEHANELYLDLLDGYVSRDNRPDWLIYAPHVRRFGDQLELAPLFSAVYHEFTVTFGEPTPIAEPGLGMSRLHTSYARGIASNLVRGKIPSASVTRIDDADTRLLDLFRRVAQATGSYAHQYVILGQMLRPPKLNVPETAFEWLDTDLATGGLQTRSMSSPAVLAGAWRSPSGHVGYALANITYETQRFSLPLAAEGVVGPYLVYAVRDGAYEVLHEGNDLPSVVDISLGPWGVGLVAIVSPGSEEADLARAQPTATAAPEPTATPTPQRGGCRGAAVPLAACCLLVIGASRRERRCR